MNFEKEIVEKALFLCQEFVCGECPYDKYQSHEYPIKCMSMLISDLCEIKIKELENKIQEFKEEENKNACK